MSDRAGEPGGLAAQMQEAVLPRQLPVLPLVDVAATYVVPEDQVGVGGDWFDAVSTPDGRLALVVGDVVGRGIEAVATMAQLRAVLRERLRGGASLGEALLATDAAAGDVAGGTAATACAAVLDPMTGALAYCTAGHPPPLLVDADGCPAYLPRTGSGALATGATFSAAEAELGDGELLVLYTDGAVEGRNRPTSQGTLDLAELVAAAYSELGGGHGIRGAVDSICQRTVADLVGSGLPADDLALVAVERMPQARPLSIVAPAEPATVRGVRERLWEWLDELQVRDLDATAVLHAVGELVSNAVEHAYREAPPPGDAVQVTATLGSPGEVVVVVRDQGRWRSGGPSGRQRGLTMARGFADGLELDRGPDGTRAVLRHRVGRPVRMFRSRREPAPPVREDMRTSLAVVAEDNGRMRVEGAVDELSAERLREQLLHWTRGGTASLVVDLSGVSFLASVGVQLLAEALAWTHDDAALQIVAAPGCPAQHVLETTGLPYDAR